MGSNRLFLIYSDCLHTIYKLARYTEVRKVRSPLVGQPWPTGTLPCYAPAGWLVRLTDPAGIAGSRLPEANLTLAFGGGTSVG
jgi:hypothetical protein